MNCVAGVYHLRRLPLGGKLSPKVTDEGATDLPNGAEEKFRWGDRREPPFLFLQGKVGYGIAPSSAPVCALEHLPPEGKALGVGNPPIGYPIPFRPTDSPGRAHPAGPGGSPQKDPRGPTNLSAQRTRPVGHASQSSAGRSRRKRMQSCFDRLRRPKHTSQPPVCPQGARSGCIPQFWEGPPTKQNIRHPRTLPSRTKLSPRLPLPKFPS